MAIDNGKTDPTNDAAVSAIRHKVASLYADEPNAKQELAEAEHSKRHSRHQQYMLELSSSGKSLAEIQTKWHQYYAKLTDEEKHEVWQEFYSKQASIKEQGRVVTQPKELRDHRNLPTVVHQAFEDPPTPRRSVAETKKHLLRNVSIRGSASKKKRHTQSLLFGLAIGSFAVLVLMFGFFNERFIAPFITPSRTVTNTPIIVDPNATTTGSSESKVIIPKINVEVPVVYDETSTDEKAIQKDLERGVVHYATTSLPGQKGNVVIVGHSSNNIFNSGKFKFAFVLLRKLEQGDLVILQYEGKRYVYKVFEKKVVKPTDVSVLSPKLPQAATTTLITCDPPGTSINRMIVVAEQITPDPAQNTDPARSSQAKEGKTVPGNAESLWQRITSWFTS